MKNSEILSVLNEINSNLKTLISISLKNTNLQFDKNIDENKTSKETNKKYFPKNKSELEKLIKDESISLGDIDTSQITNMSSLFFYFKRKDWKGIEIWDVSNVIDMGNMFANSNFNGNISNWDVSKVENMSGMFAFSKFNQDISKWKTKNVRDMSTMFWKSKFNGDISNWDVSNVENMYAMFAYSKFNGDISKWNVWNVKNMSGMFANSNFNGDISKWNVWNVENINYIFGNRKFYGKHAPRWNPNANGVDELL